MNEPQLFIVRVWRHADLFRASVRAVGDEQARLFSEPNDVAKFLAATVGAAPTLSHEAGGPDDDHP